MSKVNALDSHPDDEAIEAFVMGHIDPATCAQMQLHLEACADCQDRCLQIDEFVRAFKSALGNPNDQDP